MIWVGLIGLSASAAWYGGRNSADIPNERKNDDRQSVVTLQGDPAAANQVSTTLAETPRRRNTAAQSGGTLPPVTATEEGDPHQGGHSLLVLQRLMSGAPTDRPDPNDDLYLFKMQVAGITDVAELQSLWTTLTSNAIEEQPLGFEVRQAILEQWVRLDGPGGVAALASVSNRDDVYDHDAFSRMMDVWAEADPLAALEWYHSSAQNDLTTENGFSTSSSFYEKTFGEFFKHFPKEAVESVSAITDYEDASSAVGGMVEKSAHPGHLMEIFEGLKASEDLISREALIAHAYSRANMPEHAAEWVDQVPSQNLRIELARRIADQWVIRDPYGVADWLYKHARNRPDGLQIVESVLAKHSPTAMDEWRGRKKEENL